MRRSVLLWVLLLSVSTATAEASDPAERMQFADGLYVRGLHDMAVEEYLAILREGAEFEKTDLVLYRIGECRRLQGDGKSADEFYRRLAASFPESPYRFRADLRRAEQLLASERFADAAGLFEELLKKKMPADVEASALYYLGYARARLGEKGRDSAESPLRELLEKHKKSPLVSYAALELAALLGRQEGKGAEVRAMYERALDKPPSDRVAAEALFQLAEVEYAAQEFGRSAEAYGRLLKEYPGDQRVPEARLQAAWSWFHTGRFDEALGLARDALPHAAGEARTAWLYLQANCERQRGHADEARRLYDDLLNLQPATSLAGVAAYEKALLSFNAGDYARAIEEAVKLDAAGEHREDVNWLLAESYAATRAPAKSAEHYLRVVEDAPDSGRAPVAMYRYAVLEQEAGRFEAASRHFRMLTEKYPEHELVPAARFASGYCRTRLGRSQEALEDWTALAAGFPHYARRADALYQKAFAETDLDLPGEAKSTLRGLLREYPEADVAGAAHHLLAMLVEQEGQLDEAERELESALEAKGDDTFQDRVRLRLVTVLQKAGKLDEAADALAPLFPRSVTLVPPAMLEWLARYRLEQGDADSAAAAAEALAGIGPEAAWKQIGWSLAGQAFAKDGNLDRARSCYEQALEQKSTTREGCEAALALGGFALDDGNYERAEHCFRQAGEMAQDAELVDLRARSYYGLGRTAWARGAWEEAAKYFLSVAILFDDPSLTPECLYRAAEAFEKLDRATDRDKALVELETRYPDSHWAAQSRGSEVER